MPKVAATAAAASYPERHADSMRGAVRASPAKKARGGRGGGGVAGRKRANLQRWWCWLAIRDKGKFQRSAVSDASSVPQASGASSRCWRLNASEACETMAVTGP